MITLFRQKNLNELETVHLNISCDRKLYVYMPQVYKVCNDN